MLHELQSDSVRAEVQSGSATVTNREQHSKDRLNAVADDMYLTRVHRHGNPYIARPQAVVILAVLSTRKGAAGLLFVPADGGGRLRSAFPRILIVAGSWPSGNGWERDSIAGRGHDCKTNGQTREQDAHFKMPPCRIAEWPH